MQEVYNAAWYSQNEIQSFPLLDSNGFPTSLVVDIRVSTLSDEPVYLAGITNSADLVTAIIGQGDSIVLSITLRKPVDIYRYYKMESYDSSVAGSIVFGTGIKNNFGIWQLSSDDGLLSPSTIIKRRGLPVTSIRKEGISAKLLGNVVLSGSGDMQVAIDNIITSTRGEQRAIVFYAGSETSKSSEVMRRYANSGCCTARPDNNTDDDCCACKGITSIGGASPDDAGNIVIRTADDITLDQQELYSDGITKCGQDRCTAHMIYLSDSGEVYKPIISFNECTTDKCVECSNCNGSQQQSEENQQQTLPEDGRTWIRLDLQHMNEITITGETVYSGVSGTLTCEGYALFSVAGSPDVQAIKIYFVPVVTESVSAPLVGISKPWYVSSDWNDNEFNSSLLDNNTYTNGFAYCLYYDAPNIYWLVGDTVIHQDTLTPASPFTFYACNVSLGPVFFIPLDNNAQQ